MSATVYTFDRDARAGRKPAPHNIEAEQTLLGAILVNNKCFDRVSDFLEPKHFFEPVHQRIYEIAGDVIRAGKVATPVTLQNSLPADVDGADLTVNQYLVRLSAEATTIINAKDYGIAIYDLATRRDLITVSEEAIDYAKNAPPDCSPRDRINDYTTYVPSAARAGRSKPRTCIGESTKPPATSSLGTSASIR
jgi:replicative DNA helicase